MSVFNIGATVAWMEKGASAGADNAAEKTFDRAQKMVPLETGALEESGKVTHVGPGEAVVSYDEPYAIPLHEHPEFNFQHGRQGKWLATALDQEEHTFLADAARGFVGV